MNIRFHVFGRVKVLLINWNGIKIVSPYVLYLIQRESVGRNILKLMQAYTIEDLILFAICICTAKENSKAFTLAIFFSLILHYK